MIEEKTRVANERQVAIARSVYSFLPEDIRVTFQVGMVASDGIILASDCLYIQEIGGLRSTYSAEKIVVGSDALLGYCCAGDELVTRTASALCAMPFHAEDDFRGRMVAAIQTARMEFMADDFRGGHILAVLKRDKDLQLWFTAVSKGHAIREVRSGKVIAGDAANAAVFFTERYFPKGRTRTICELLPLAAHTVLMAGKLNPGGVDGLEIATFTESGGEKMTAEQLAPLIASSTSLDRQIVESLGLA